ncbi:deoxyribonuclease V [Zooshikella ganghwensis]|uniref:Endonuclease V n=1 Tax=Zooshikella ganghwensis TaxID=202772 RepID=A0A4P9VR74_9GAMM|nr:deoxyribonuclease V [Zooshikella ganghwensis]RDH46088.1 deoxyribonuclease V [Zooshikella ganghwensis]
MKAHRTHSWNLTIDQAQQLQAEWSTFVKLRPLNSSISTVAGVDVAYDTQHQLIVAGVVLLSADSLELIESHVTYHQTAFPYFPGLLSFREIPAILPTLEQLSQAPDLIICDGQGIAHPRFFGLASHLGVLMEIPTIGCAKTHYWGEYEPPRLTRGSTSPILADNQTIGHVVCTQNNTKPVFVSPGHLTQHQDAIDWVLKCSNHYRQPQTTRLADQLVRKHLKQLQNC